MEKEYYDFHKNQQFQHWWFLGRNKIIDTYIQKNNTGTSNEILDIGSGYGACIPVLKKFGNVDALEPYAGTHQSLVDLGAKTVYQFENFPKEFPDKKYDIVTLFDVLEHIEDDILALQTIRKKLLNEKGKIFITVPAHMWLWTEHDVKNHHFRRYSKKSLKEALKKAGFKNFRVNYFMTLLFPIALVERAIGKIKPSKTVNEEKLPRFNKILKNIFGKESSLINKIKFPFGLSLIVEADR